MARFLVLTQYFAPEVGASQVRLAAMVRELVAAGHQVEVVTAMPNHPAGRIFHEYRGRFYLKEQWEGVTVHRIWIYAAMGAGMKRILNYLSFTFLSLIALARCEKPDYLFVESPPLFHTLTAYLASRCWRVPFIFNVADLWPDSVKRLGLMKDGWMLRLAERWEAWAYRKAAFVNAVTEGIRVILLGEKGLPAEKVLFLNNGVDLERFRPLPPDEGLRASLGLGDRPLLVYAGTHGFAHGVEVALYAARLLPQVGFVFLGDGSEKPKLQALAKELALENVRFLDPVPMEELARYYAISVGGLSTLRRNPLFVMTRPVKIFGNMACAKPVVYVGEGEGAELIRGAGSGPVVPPEDPEALADAIRRLLADPDGAAEMGRRGRAFVEANMSWQALVGGWLKELEARHA